MENAYLCLEETGSAKTARCGIHIKESATMYQPKSTKSSAVSSSMKSNKNPATRQKISAQLSKSAAWFQKIMSTSICRKKQRYQALISTSKMRSYGSLSLAREQGTSSSKKE